VSFFFYKDNQDYFVIRLKELLQRIKMSLTLIEKVKARANSKETRTDMFPGNSIIYPKLTKIQLDRTEKELGFTLPPLLVSVYQEIGNGGFGPGYGLLGVNCGAADDIGENAVDAYNYYKSAEEEEGDAKWAWPEGLLPICHWGCAIYSCVDCFSPDFKLVTLEPNLMDEENGFTKCIIPQNHTLESWFNAWVDNVKLWDEMFGQ
jgi:hypothetical protein